jgi:hypothetical protein
MVKPQQPELARNRLGSTDRDGKELRVDEVLPENEKPSAPIPDANQAGHEPQDVQDKPAVPPHERHDREER